MRCVSAISSGSVFIALLDRSRWERCSKWSSLLSTRFKDIARCRDSETDYIPHTTAIAQRYLLICDVDKSATEVEIGIQRNSPTASKCSSEGGNPLRGYSPRDLMHSLVLGFSMCCALRGGRGVRETERCWLGVSFRTFSSSLSWLGSAWEGGREGGREGERGRSHHHVLGRCCSTELTLEMASS